MSIDRGMDKKVVRERERERERYIYIYIYTHTHNVIILSHKKNEIMSFAATWEKLEAVKTKYHMISPICET